MTSQKRKIKDENRKPKILSPKQALDYANKISQKDLDLLGLHYSHPRNMIMNYLPIAPMSCRPNILQMGAVHYDQMTDLYKNLLSVINETNTTVDKTGRESNRQCIANKFRTILKSSGSESEQDAAQKAKGICERLKGKPGRMRMNVMGKRVNYCSRSVISGDPTISIDQLGVPRSVAARLSFPEVVNERNIDYLQELVKNGAHYPGANAIEYSTGEIMRLDEMGTGNGEEPKLKYGDIVHRHLRDDDYVMFNRQPSLHKMSFMAHRVKVLPYSTFRLNLCCTKPYNADFDGDEMNCHEP